MSKWTHKEVSKPQISARFLADYMAAGQRERARRSIIQGCKYQSLARMFQHDEAKAVISKFIRSKNQNVDDLIEKADILRGRSRIAISIAIYMITMRIISLGSPKLHQT